jgi:pimeloyl-ACP methyl ester carboxylesterase
MRPNGILKALAFSCLFFIFLPVKAQQNAPKIQKIYLLHGLAADARLFKNLELDSTYQLYPILLDVPLKNETMQTYAQRISQQIDTTQPFALIGVSFGGMVCTELSQLIPAQKVILIASAGCRSELPKRYSRMNNFPIYKIVPGSFMKWSSFIVQPLFERDRQKEKITFNAMLRDKNPKFLKNATRLIVTWDRKEKPQNLLHVHGNNDHTIPLKNVKADYIIENGSHLMVLTRGKELSPLLNRLLKDN